MIDIRYHIATLIAVFLALGLGILIGSTLVNNDVVTSQQQKMIDQLKQEFEDLRAQKAELSTQTSYLKEVLNYYDEMNREMMPPLIKNRLQGEQVALVVTGGAQIPPDMLNTLDLAGAKVASTTVFLPNANLEDQGLRLKLCEFFKLPADTSREDLQKLIATTVARIICADGGQNEISFLRQMNLVKMNGQFGVPVNGVIVIGGADDPAHYYPSTIDVPLIQYLKSVNKQLYGVEAAQTTESYMDYYQKMGISTIDDIDLTVGQIALVLAMDGEPGNFGIKKTAKKFMPALPVEYLGGVGR